MVFFMKYATPPNCLTLSRLFLAPFIIPWSIITSYINPLVVFSVVASTDMLDGWCARMWSHETTLGKWLDPLADKIVLASVVFPLVYTQVMHWSIALLFMIREFVVLAARHIAALSHVTIHVSRWGKMKTNLQFLYIALCFVDNIPGIAYMRAVALSAAVVVTCGSMLQYVQQGMYAVDKGSV